MSPLTCDDVGPRVEVWLDGVLSEAETALIETHLRGCEACRQEVAFGDALRADLAFEEFEINAVSVAAEGRWRQALTSRRRASSPRWRRVAWAGVAVAATLLATASASVIFGEQRNGGTDDAVFGASPRPGGEVLPSADRIDTPRSTPHFESAAEGDVVIDTRDESSQMAAEEPERSQDRR